MDNKNQTALKSGFFLSTSAQPFWCISHNPQLGIGCHNDINSLCENREFWNFTFTAQNRKVYTNPTTEIRRYMSLMILVVWDAPPMSRMCVPMPMMWLRMRVSSANITRMYLARSGTSIFNSFSTASE
jgi:hypothetical protein